MDLSCINILAAMGTILVSFITLLGAMFGIMKFLLKDITKDVHALQIEQKEIKNDIKGWVQHLMAMQSEQSKRMDQLQNHVSELVRTRKI